MYTKLVVSAIIEKGDKFLFGRKAEGIGILVIIPVVCLLATTHWLTCRDKLEQADIIVVPTGNMYLRCDQGITLKKRSWASKILFTGKTGSKNASNFKKRALTQGIKQF